MRAEKEIFMHVFDMHCDSLLTISSERGLVNEYNVSKSNPFVQFFAAFVPSSERAPEVRRAELMRHFNVYLYETERLDIKRIQDARDLNECLDRGLPGGVFSIEGGGGLFADSPELVALYNGGLRFMGLCWDTNELATGAWDENDLGLTERGREMALVCEELGVTLDVSHLSDRSFYQLMEVTRYPVVATHSNFRDVCRSRRNLTLDMAKEIAARGGIIGLNLYPPFLSGGERAAASDILRHVDYALERLGERALALGCDIDGTDGLYPAGFAERASIHDRLAEVLLGEYSSSVVEKILCTNAKDFLLGAL
jgi:membrane dipeptidase